jgi:hypothetical protein
LRRARLAETTIREKLKVLPCKVSFTFDAWTSQPGDPYLSVTGHYIDAPINRPNDWVLKTEQLAFETIEGRHTGKNISLILEHTVDRYVLKGKVGWFTADGAAVNGTTIREFGNGINNGTDTADHGWTAQEHDIL